MRNVILLMLQRRGQSYGAQGVSAHVSNTSGCNLSANETTLPIGACRPCSSATTHVTGRSPSLVAMEKVMPKYAGWASSDAAVARWHLIRDRKNLVDEYSPSAAALMQPECSAVGSPCRNLSALPVRHLPAAEAAGGTLGLMPADVMTALTSSSSDSGSLHSAKEELRARLTRPASSSALCNFSQVGKAAFMMLILLTLITLSCRASGLGRSSSVTIISLFVLENRRAARWCSGWDI